MIRTLALVLATGLSAACGGDDENACFSDAQCTEGQRCVRTTGEGRCEACDADEIPYDGVDNDCRPSTFDRDLDGDGDNWIDAPVGPGTDCDDNDPNVSGIRAELCDDGIDNNCDGTIDEPTCGDMAPPTVTFVSPVDGAEVVGSVAVEVQLNDDVGVAGYAIFLDAGATSAELASESFEPTVNRVVRTSFDSALFSDGPVTIRAVATDAVGAETTASIDIFVDNASGPRLTILSPIEGGAYGGRLDIRARVTDASGVEEVVARFGGEVVGTATTGAELVELDVNTVGRDETQSYRVELTATDGLGNQTVEFVTVTVDNTPPTVAFESPAANSNVSGVITVAVLANDRSGIRRVELEGLSGNAQRTEFSLDTRTLPNGLYTLTATAVDRAAIDGGLFGNVSVAERTVTIANAEDGPIVNFVTPTPGQVVIGQTPIQLDILPAAGRTVRSVSFSVDGQIIAELTTPPWSTTFNFSREGLRDLSATATDSTLATSSATITVSVANPATLRFSPTFPLVGIDGRAQLAADDIDGDGVGDVVVTGEDPAVIWGGLDTNGDWEPDQTDYLSSPNGDPEASDVEIIDINQDGRLDLVMASYDAFEVRLGAATSRTFLPAARYATDPQFGDMTELAVADLDDDGNMDIVVGGEDSVGVVYYGDAQSVFDTSAAERRFEMSGVAHVRDLVAYDVNRDGLMDLGVGRSEPVAVTVFINSTSSPGAPQFGAGIDTTTDGNPTQIRFGDLDADGVTDMVTVEAVSGTGDLVGTYLGRSFPPGAFSVSDYGWIQDDASGLELEKLPGTQEVRRIFAGTGAMNGFEVWTYAAGSLSHQSAWVTARDASFPTIFDLDGDGLTDVVTLGNRDDALAISKGVGGNQFFAGYVRPIGNEFGLATNLGGTAIGDILGTGTPDVVVSSFGGSTTYELVDGALVPRGNGLIDTLNFNSAAIADFDGQNGLDFFWDNQGAPRVALADPSLGDGYQLSLPAGIRLGQFAGAAAVDIDRDGVQEAVFVEDIVNFAGLAHIFTVEATTETATVVREYVRDVGEEPVQVFVADMDGDGNRDIGVTNADTRDVAFIGSALNDVQGTVLYNAVNDLAWVASDNFGAVPDGVPDLAGVAQSRGMFFMEGDPVTGYRVPVFTNPGIVDPTVIDSGDFNGDGIVDCLVVNRQEQISIVLGRGTSNRLEFFPGITIASAGTPSSAQSLDVDGDGDEDVVLTTNNTGAVIIFFSEAAN